MKNLYTLTLVLTLLFLTSNATFSQTQMGIDIDCEDQFDHIGYAVDMSTDGSITAIGAYTNDGNGTDAGHVRILAWDGTAWNQMGADIDGDAAGERSGSAVALSADGSIVAIGSPKSSNGHVKVFEWNGTTWNQLGANLTGEAIGDEFGNAVSLSTDGSKLAVGGFLNDGTGNNAGHVRIFEWNGTAWNQLGSDIDGEAAGDQSGISVSLSADGELVAIGANKNDGNGSNSGHVKIFTYNTGFDWSQKGNDIDGEAAGDESGLTVSISSDGTTVAIGANLNDGNGANSGHTRVYQLNGALWIQLGADIDGEDEFNFSGNSVSISANGKRLIIGAPSNSGNGSLSGHARIFYWIGTGWSQLGTDIDGEANGDQSGFSVAISPDGSRVIIGAFSNDGDPMINNCINSGHARMFDLSSISLDFYFIGSVNNKWDNPANWNTCSIPTISDDVYLDNTNVSGGVEIPNGYAAFCNSFQIDNLNSSSTFESNSSLTLAGNLDIHKGEIFLNGTLAAESFNVEADGNVEANGVINFMNSQIRKLFVKGFFENYGDIYHDGLTGGDPFIEVFGVGATFNNFGLIQQLNNDFASLKVVGTFNNKSTGELIFRPANGTSAFIINISGSSTIFNNEGELIIEPEGSNEIATGILVRGTFNNHDSGIVTMRKVASQPLTLSSFSQVINEGLLIIGGASFTNKIILGNSSGSSTSIFTNTSTGTLQGEGEIEGTIFNFDGFISPGSSPGKITFDGDFEMADGTYLCEIEGTSGAGVTGGNDEFEVTGTNNLSNGNLTVTLLNGFSPSLGDEFTILSATTAITNTFANTTLPALSTGLIWKINYNATTVVLEVISDPLPVELSNFEVLEKNKKHYLNWITQSETNSSHFEIEYSSDGIFWKKKGSVPARGESILANNYSFENNWERNFELHYYRLKIVDLDDTFEYSEIKSIRSDGTMEVNIFPNPFSEIIIVEVPSGNFEIFDSFGKSIIRSTSSSKEINLSNFPDGIYFVKYLLAGEIYTKSITKQN